MNKKRVLMVVAVVAMGAIAITAWVAMGVPSADLARSIRLFGGPTSEQTYAGSRGELPAGAGAMTASAAPTSQQLYAANRGELSPRRVASPSAGPTTEQIYAANKGELAASGK